jgi:hypothetical protein
MIADALSFIIDSVDSNLTWGAIGFLVCLGASIIFVIWFFFLRDRGDSN